MNASAPLHSTDIPGFPKYRGKVRDVYDLGSELLIVATDRLSAFDVVFPDAIPMKGIVLTQFSRWWFERTRSIVANHVIAMDVADFPVALRPFGDQLEGRSMLVKKTRPLPAEFVVRGYLDGSAFREYSTGGKVCGVELPAGLQRASRLPEPVLTPTTKASEGHDEPIDFQQLAQLVGLPVAALARDFAISLYSFAHEDVLGKGLILSDTKFEFGIDADGSIILIDEALTPDSSRYWLKDTYVPGAAAPVSLDKQYVRDYVEKIGWGKKPPAPRLPEEVICQTTDRYLRAFEVITGAGLT